MSYYRNNATAFINVPRDTVWHQRGEKCDQPCRSHPDFQQWWGHPAAAVGLRCPWWGGCASLSAASSPTAASRAVWFDHFEIKNFFNTMKNAPKPLAKKEKEKKGGGGGGGGEGRDPKKRVGKKERKKKKRWGRVRRGRKGQTKARQGNLWVFEVEERERELAGEIIFLTSLAWELFKQNGYWVWF